MLFFSLIQSYNLATHTAEQPGRMHFMNALKVAKLGFFVSRNAKRPRFKLILRTIEAQSSTRWKGFRNEVLWWTGNRVPKIQQAIECALLLMLRCTHAHFEENGHFRTYTQYQQENCRIFFIRCIGMFIVGDHLHSLSSVLFSACICRITYTTLACRDIFSLWNTHNHRTIWKKAVWI